MDLIVTSKFLKFLLDRKALLNKAENDLQRMAYSNEECYKTRFNFPKSSSDSSETLRKIAEYKKKLAGFDYYSQYHFISKEADILDHIIIYLAAENIGKPLSVIMKETIKKIKNRKLDSNDEEFYEKVMIRERMICLEGYLTEFYKARQDIDDPELAEYYYPYPNIDDEIFTDAKNIDREHMYSFLLARRNWSLRHLIGIQRMIDINFKRLNENYSLDNVCKASDYDDFCTLPDLSPFNHELKYNYCIPQKIAQARELYALIQPVYRMTDFMLGKSCGEEFKLNPDDKSDLNFPAVNLTEEELEMYYDLAVTQSPYYRKYVYDDDTIKQDKIIFFMNDLTNKFHINRKNEIQLFMHIHRINYENPNGDNRTVDEKFSFLRVETLSEIQMLTRFFDNLRTR